MPNTLSLLRFQNLEALSRYSQVLFAVDFLPDWFTFVQDFSLTSMHNWFLHQESLFITIQSPGVIFVGSFIVDTQHAQTPATLTDNLMEQIH